MMLASGKKPELDNDEVIEDLMINEMKIIQSKKGFRFGIDAVELAKFANSSLRQNDNILDMCSGTGIVPLLLVSMGRDFSGATLEIQEKYSNIIEKNMLLNNISGITVKNGDLKNIEDYFERESFSVVTCNPPYMVGNTLISPEKEKSIARSEIECTIYDVARAVSYCLKPKGRLYMVHRCDRQVDIMLALTENKLEPKRIQYVHSYAGDKPVLVLIEAVKYANRGLKILKPRILYLEEGR